MSRIYLFQGLFRKGFGQPFGQDRPYHTTLHNDLVIQSYRTKPTARSRGEKVQRASALAMVETAKEELLFKVTFT
eukprot:scaffold19336_cov199-Amphora_coffeaeformis.AAC.2